MGLILRAAILYHKLRNCSLWMGNMTSKEETNSKALNAARVWDLKCTELTAVTCETADDTAFLTHRSCFPYTGSSCTLISVAAFHTYLNVNTPHYHTDYIADADSYPVN